jgi:hypothetical protein
MIPLAHLGGLLPALPFVVPMLVVVAFLAQLAIRDRLRGGASSLSANQLNKSNKES